MSSFTRLTSLVVLATTLGSNAADVVLNLPIVNGDISPDGFTRGAVLAGGTFPGPLITGNKGDRFKINVQDELTDDTMLRGTSIHWHGFFQKGSNEMDGATWVTQCPIAPLSSFEYDFSSAEQAGTMWYHSHLSSQYCDGLRGAMVVYDPADPHASLYDVDNAATVITLADWYHTKAKVQPLPATPSSHLINGLGRFDGVATPLSVVTVTAGLRYRFRIVSLSCDSNFIFSIHGHTFSVIEADTENTLPELTSSVQVFAGQRYSVVMKADQTVGNYWIRAKPNVGVDTTFDNGANSAILRYVGAAVVEPTTTDPADVPLLLETSLHPLTSAAAPGLPVLGGADFSLNLALSNDGLFRVNGAAFEPPTVPVLLQIMSGAAVAQDLLPAGSVYELPLNSVIELSIPATGAPGGPHPFHLHGHTFSVVRSAGSTDYNYVDPVRRDVVSIGGGTDNVTIRFVTDNAGPWFLHCHIDWHLETGLAVVFAEGISQSVAANPTSAAWDSLCPAWNELTPGQQRNAARPSQRLSGF